MDRASTRSLTTARRDLCPDDVTPHDGDQRALFIAWQQHGDETAREHLVERYMPLARRLARRYMRGSEPAEDILQVAAVGLIQAVDRYDVDRGQRFVSFAVPTILGEIRRYFRDSSWALHVPRAAKERALEVREAQSSLSVLHGRSPTAEQIAEYLELDVELVFDALAATQAHDTCSLDTPRHGEDGSGESYADTLGEEDERLELVECDVTLRSGLAELAPRDRLILRMRYVEELTQTEIAGRIGISQMQVSRLLRRVLDHLRGLAEPPAEVR